MTYKVCLVLLCLLFLGMVFSQDHSQKKTVSELNRAPKLAESSRQASSSSSKERSSVNQGEDVSSPSDTEVPESSSKETLEGVAIGQRHQLPVPPMVQKEWNFCAPTTVSMLLAYKGISSNQYQLAQEMKTDNSFGTHNANAIQILNRYLFGYDYPQGNQAGYRLAEVTDVQADMALFKESVMKNTADGYPMYYTIELSKIYPDKRGEHNVLGDGYIATPDGKDVAFLYYLDPSYVSQDPVYGGLKIITPEKLLDAMVVCAEPNYAW